MSVTDPAGSAARLAARSIVFELFPGREHEALRRKIVFRVLEEVVPHVGQESRNMAARLEASLRLREDEYQRRRGQSGVLRDALRHYLPGAEHDGGAAAQRAMRATNWTAPDKVPARLVLPETSYDVHVVGHGTAAGLEDALRIPATTIGEAVDMLLNEYTRGDIEGGEYAIRVRRSAGEDGPPPLPPAVDPIGDPPDPTQLSRRRSTAACPKSGASSGYRV